MRDEANTKAGSPLINKSLGDTIQRASREKTWDECGIEEKVERLHRAMRDQKHMVEVAYRTASTASDLAHGHQHNPATGEVLKPANDRRGGAEVMGRSFDPLS